MSAETQDKKETETKLMADQNERDKSYGTDGAVIVKTEEPNSSHNHNQDQEAGTEPAEHVMKRYNTIINRIRLYETTDTHADFLNRMVSFVFNTIAGIIALLVANIIQVACIIMGSVYMKDCPTSPGIPIILVVNGAVNVLICIIESIKRRINRNSDIMKRLYILMTLLKIGSLICFISWIYIVYDTNYPTFDDPNDQNYCNKTVFLFAFWLLNVYLILISIILFITCCCCCFFASAVANDKASS